ncbi:DUF2642 domain-containing protein [Psychrobacillus sp. INOP01]|uniref:DUF2642 domain-containing protein n=1 Tax=Psychrobacillus sp. INOP01 TaxID=2829187 RepID=UPI001BA7E60E|nr:DUF2642 domain-containing protein [Psychrobacillus sp. INOP01]QUG40883.1 DUF2642 domain-containing protein [Psychrobacillus sp. INOP01]
MQKQNFENVLYANENMNIGLYLTKNQFVEGILLDVQNNHIVLEVNENIVYIAIHQIQALSKNAKDLRMAKESSLHLVRNDLTDVLIALRYHWVTINKFSNPTLFGILSSIFEDHIILINKKELFYIPISHITDISSEISKSDHYFLNKKEQRTIQKLYRMRISKESIEVKDDHLIGIQDRITSPDIGIIADWNDAINKGKADQSTVSSLLEEKADISVSDQELAAIDDGIHTEVMEPINTYAIEESVFSSQMEETLESKSLDIAAAAANILVSEEKLSTIHDGVHKEVPEPINTDTLEENEFYLKLKEKLESISLNLAAAAANNLGSEEKSSPIVDGVHTEVTEPINTDELEENTFSPQLEDQIIKEQTNEFSDEQLNVPENRLEMKGKDILLTAWSTMNSDQSTVALPKKADSKRKHAIPIENTMLTSSNTGQQTSLSNQTNENSDRHDKLDVLDKISETSEKKKQVLTANVLSRKEVNEMLEQQYFALMNYAAVQISNTINFKQTDNKSYFHPRVEGSEYRPDKIRRFEMNSGYQFYDSKQDTAALEKQYISLMRHATAMYRKLRKT